MNTYVTRDVTRDVTQKSIGCVTRDVTVADLDLDLENNNTPRDVNVVTRARSLVSTSMMLNEGERR